MVVFVRRGSLIFALGVLAIAPSCSSVPTFPPPPRDAGTHCSDAEPCPSGQSCLQGLCYAACDMTHPCSAREMCQSGVCVARTSDGGMPPRDAGMDGGPCAMMTCMTPTPVCRADVASCLQCDADNHDECGSTTGPVCDVGRGSCTTGATTVCAPCNVTADCMSGLTCVHRSSPDAEERVCLPACTSVCADPGFTCMGTSCIPFVGSCTAYRAAITSRACTMDSDCPQLGATVDNGLVTGMCFGAAAGDPMTCHAACGATTDCPTGRTCLASPAGGAIHFCQ